MYGNTYFALNKGAETPFRVTDDFDTFDGRVRLKVLTQWLRDLALVRIGWEAVTTNVS